MQTLFDLPMSSSLSYLVAVIVILGLLAIFAVIVRRVAGQGLRTESGRGRGPRLGVVDTYALDRTRQLVIIRRDDVEHLLMIGGTNDVLIESNIVRAISAASLREPQTPMLAQTAQFTPQYDAPPHRMVDDDEPLFVPQPAPVIAPAQPAPQAPRVKMAPQPAPQPTPSYAPRQPAPAESQPVTEQNQAAREALNNAELQALAKRLEASIPPMPPKVEKPAQPQQVSLAPEPRPIPQAAPVPQPLPPSAPIPQPVPIPVQPPAPPAPQMAAPVMPAAPVSPPVPQPPVMPQPRPPVMPAAQPMPTPPQPVVQQAAPMPAPAPAQIQPEAPKDRQAAALDENLRRLLGRKLDPRT